jgi:hypothetical protein
MPRTNQTSRKSTGGIVPRAAFALFATNDSLDSADDGNSYNSDASDNSRAGSADGDTVESAEGRNDNIGLADDNASHEVSLCYVFCDFSMITCLHHSGLLLHMHEWWESLLVREVHARHL